MKAATHYSLTKTIHMKLLIITSIKEDVHGVNQIMEKAGIPVFSVTATAGHKTQHHSYALDNWFGKNENTTDNKDAVVGEEQAVYNRPEVTA